MKNLDLHPTRLVCPVSVRRGAFAVCLVSVLALGVGARGAAATPRPLPVDEHGTVPYPLFILLTAPEGGDFAGWREELAALGVPLVHAFPPAGGIVAASTIGDPSSLDALPAGTRCFIEPPEGPETDRLLASPAGLLLRHAHRALSGLEPLEPEEAGSTGQPLVDDGLPGPVEHRKVTCSADALYRTTSEYLLGTVSVTIVLPESTGAASTEDWTLQNRIDVTNEIMQGLTDVWIAYSNSGLASALQPSWTYHVIDGRTDTRAQITVEPINGPHPTDASPSWVNTIYNRLGYTADATMWDKGRHFNGDQRAADGTDWAYTIFVVNSISDADGLFSDLWSAYSYMGGPFAMMTYDNGSWGIGSMDSVLRHETMHVFYALDEYSTSSCACSQTSGYVSHANANCDRSCSSNQFCVMRTNHSYICPHTRGMIGWGDQDSDLVPDPVDILPETMLVTYGPPTADPTLDYNGLATIQARPNQNVYHYMCDANVLDVASVSWRVDGGSWSAGSPSDGQFDEPSEWYYLTTNSLGPGVHTVEAVASDSVGQTDPSAAQDQATVYVAPPGVPSGISGSAMTVAKLVPDGSQLRVNWDVATCGWTNHDLVYGMGSTLPTTPGGSYGTVGGACGLGSTGVHNWTGVPDPGSDATRLLWWLVLATDGAIAEGSWGTDSFGSERSCGWSGCTSPWCGSVVKDTTNTCGQ